jgi:hypothetical protein
MTTKYEFLGDLPEGKWRFMLLTIAGQPDVIVVVDESGMHAPRMVIGAKLVELP